MPPTPSGAKFWKLSASKEVSAATMKKIRIPILRTTMIMFARLLSRVPRISRKVIAMTMMTAGRLNTPPSSGEVEIASGIRTPNAESRKALTLPPQPTATAATETPYSRIRSQPMMKATSSPIVA
jgi:hypothetical protein